MEERLDNYYTDLEEPHCYILRKVIDRTESAKPQEQAQEAKAWFLWSDSDTTELLVL